MAELPVEGCTLRGEHGEGPAEVFEFVVAVHPYEHMFARPSAQGAN